MNRKSRKLQFIRKKNHKRKWGMKGDEVISLFGMPPMSVDDLLDKGYRISSALRNLK